ncbi:unnamed protein product [Phytophthora lilii]|uniref:Unnamed protein product n=1 Tax=Phytophthora lilii TaxID=2077276 RepID=A0A9W6WW27_9STRA|nr:unnamed protein product [Phytophthora lilii]
MQRQIRRLEAQLAQLIAAAAAAAQSRSSAAFGQLLLRTERLRAQKQRLESDLQHFRVKLGVETQEEMEAWHRLAKRGLEGDDADANRHRTSEQRNELEALPGRPQWMAVSTASELVQFATDMFLANAERTDALVSTANLVLGWRDKRAVLEHTSAQFLLTKDFLHQLAESLVERTWKATVNVDQLRGMLKWTAGMKVHHRLSENAYVVCRELHLPNSADAEHPICYKYQLIIFRAETPNGFIISTQNISLSGGADATMSQMLDQRLLRLAGIPLVTMYGFLFERQYSEKTGEVVGCRVNLAGRTSDGSMSYAHKVLTEALPSILRWENTYVGPILCITSSS